MYVVQQFTMHSHDATLFRFAVEIQIHIGLVQRGPFVRKRTPSRMDQTQQDRKLHGISRQVSEMRLIKFVPQYALHVGSFMSSKPSCDTPAICVFDYLRLRKMVEFKMSKRVLGKSRRVRESGRPASNYYLQVYSILIQAFRASKNLVYDDSTNSYVSYFV